MRNRHRPSEAPSWRVCAVTLFLGLAPLAAQANQFVKLDYNLTLGNRSRDTVFIELFDDKSITRDNFMAYVNGGKYDGMFMHRLSHGFVMQGGGFYPQYQSEPTLSDVPYSLKSSPDVQVDLDGNPATPNPEIVNEYSVGTTRSNVRGMLAMARRGGEPNSASSEWFVNYANNSFLDSVDGGFTVFGQVRGDGMAYYDALDKLSTSMAPDDPNGMLIVDLNQDANNNGFRDDLDGIHGPFGSAADPTDGVPLLYGLLNNLVIVQNAERIDYFGAGSTTNVSSTGLTFTQRDAFIDTGAVFTGTGRLIANVNRTLGVREGSLSRPLNILGTFAPGQQIGRVTLPGYEQQSQGTLVIDLRGTTVDTDYDQLVVNGTAKLAGTLKVTLLNGFSPLPGNQFTILTATTKTGSFQSFDLPTTIPGYFWNLDSTATALKLVMVGGDFNADGAVDAGDYTLWRNSLGSSVAAFTGADASGNGVVDAADYAIWRSYFGRVALPSGGGGSGALGAGGVPEPSSIFLAVLAGGVGVLIARRRNLARG
jgi:cyclophilin family peptidyl-prolyl cis-trans isomerase